MNKVIKAIIAFSLVIIMLTCSACTSFNDNVNGSNRSGPFYSLSQEEKQDYVKEYLLENYNMNCGLTDVRARQIDAIRNEDNYYTVATTPDDYWFAIWITTDGEIIDTEFVYEMKDEINSYIKDVLLENGISCDVRDRVLFENTPDKRWKSEEISNMFSNEKIFNNLHLYNIDENLTEKEISEALKGFTGYIFIHYSDSDFDTFDNNFSID